MDGDGQLEQRIFDFLESQHNNEAELSHILRVVKVDKRTLNANLYRLKRSGNLIKTNEKPPTWQINLRNKRTPRKHFNSKPYHPQHKNMARYSGVKVKNFVFSYTTKLHIHVHMTLYFYFHFNFHFTFTFDF